MTKLYDYQKELVESKHDLVVGNWARGAGKDFILAYIIFNEKPKNVLLEIDYSTSEYFFYKKFNESINKYYKEQVFEILENDTVMSIRFNDGKETKIHKKIEGIKHFDIIFYVEALPYSQLLPNDITANKRISLLTINNYNKQIEKDFPEAHIINVDHKTLINENVIDIDQAIEFSKSKYFFKQYAILSKPKEESLTFSEFRDEALQRLQKQFLNTGDSKDTVLTRKNIIEMIKDLKELGK